MAADEPNPDPAKFWPEQAGILRTGLQQGWQAAGMTLLDWVQLGYREIPRDDEDAEDAEDPCKDPCQRPKITYWHVLETTEDHNVIDARGEMAQLIADYHNELVKGCSDFEFPVMMLSIPFAAVIRNNKVARKGLTIAMLLRWNKLRAKATGLHDDVFWEFYVPIQSWRSDRKQTAVKPPGGLPTHVGRMQRSIFRA